jgi:predicted nucleic acid-binding Zn ribbon protein
MNKSRFKAGFRKEYIMNCKYCGKKMQASFAHRVYCSDECFRAFYKKKLKEKSTHCEICGKKLEGRKRKYCSAECLRYANKKQALILQKDEYKKPKAEVNQEPKKRGRPKKKPTLAQINAKARAEGLNYGQYVAKYGL